MNKKEEELIKELSKGNKELKGLWEEHLEFERKLMRFDERRYLTTEEALERKRIQKLKLAGKDKILEIISEYKKTEKHKE